jgi:dTDP-4-amino-4,6-dideoxygalactose transaminase
VRNTFLPYCRPDVNDEEIDAIAECIRNGWLTTGPKVREFEDAFAQLAGVKHAVAVNSCTAALHIGLLAAGVGPGDEVITPSLTFVAGAQCTLEVGATPVFCDVNQETITGDLDCIKRVVTSRTRALIVTPYAGRPMNIAEIVEFARERNITVIEDAAHAVGMLDRGEWPGTRSDLAAYSFYATKNVTTAEGGMLVTNNDAIADRVRILSLHGMDKDAWKRYTARGSWRYDVREPGFKYNMPDIAAALGIVQLKKLDVMQQRRHEIAQRYIDALADVPGIHVQAPPNGEGDRHAWCMFVIRVDESAARISRDDLIEELKARNIGTSVHYIPTHLFSGYRHFTNDHLTATERVGGQIISLPLYPTMSGDDVDDVIDAIKTSVTRQKQANAALAG